MRHQALLGPGDDDAPPLAAFGRVKGEQCHGVAVVGGVEVVERVAQLDPAAELAGLAGATGSGRLLRRRGE